MNRIDRAIEWLERGMQVADRDALSIITNTNLTVDEKHVLVGVIKRQFHFMKGALWNLRQHPRSG